MANRMKMAKTLCVLELHRQGWSFRRIARELGVHRETVAAHVRRAGSEAKPAKALTGSDPPESGVSEAPRSPNPATPGEVPIGVPGAGADADGPPEGLGRDLHTAGPGGQGLGGGAACGRCNGRGCGRFRCGGRASARGG